MKYIRIIMLAMLFLFPCIHGGKVSASVEPVTVIVTELGDHPGAAPLEVNPFNTGKVATEFVINALVDSEHFAVHESSAEQEKAAKEGCDVVGLVDSKSAKRLGELTNVRYLIYGNLTDVSVSEEGTETGTIIGGITVGTTKANIVIRMMDMSTGEIIMAAKGTGKSKSSLVNIRVDKASDVFIGTKRVTQDSVTSAIRKAAENAVNLLVERVFLQ